MWRFCLLFLTRKNKSIIGSLLFLIFLSGPSFHGWPFSNAIDPLYQMWKLFHFLFSIATGGVVLHPRPRSNIGNRILPLAFSGQVLAWLAGILAWESNFQNAKDPVGLFAEALNRNFCIGMMLDLYMMVWRVQRAKREGTSLTRKLLCCTTEEPKISLIGSTATVPEEEPLKSFAPLKLVLEAECVILVCEFQQVEKFRRRFHYGEWGWHGIVDNDGDASCRRLVRPLRHGIIRFTIWVKTEEPVLFLDISWDIAVKISKAFNQCRRKRCTSRSWSTLSHIRRPTPPTKSGLSGHWACSAW